MKNKFIFAVILTVAGLFSTSAFAWEHGRGGYHGYYHGGGWGWGWAAPAVIGGVIGYELARPPVYTSPVVVQPQPVVVQPPAGYHWEYLYVQNCACYQNVAVPNPVVITAPVANQ